MKSSIQLKSKIILSLILFLFILLLGLSPWLTLEKAENRVRVQFPPGAIVTIASSEKVPFGVIVEVSVIPCPMCQAFSRNTYFVSPISTVHNLTKVKTIPHIFDSINLF